MSIEGSSAASTRAAITADDLRARLYAVADDSTAGRAAGSPGALLAQRYIERELRRLGVAPAGEGGGYGQAPRTVVRRVGASTLVTAGGSKLELWSDFLPVPWPWRPREIDGASVIYGGEFGTTTLDSSAIAGKLVLMRPPGGQLIFPRVAPSDPLRAAAAVAVIGLERYAPERLTRVRHGLEAGLEGDPAFAARAPVSLLVTTAAAELLLGKRLADARPGDVGAPVQGAIALSDSVVSLCCNLIGVIRGSDPAVAGEYVALGAHFDHLGTTPVALEHDSVRIASESLWALRGRSSTGNAPNATRVRVDVDSIRRIRPARRDSIFNGADDDASGTVALLEIAEAMASAHTRPRRSVIFVWHTGEELGNQGSTWFTQYPTVPLSSIVAQLNLDMVGRGGENDIVGGGPHYLQVIGSRSLSRELGHLIDQVNAETGAGFRFDYQFASPSNPLGYYYRSDHASYARHCVPVAFFTTGEHADYHQVTDEPQYIDYPHLAAVTRLLFDITTRLANSERRPAIDEVREDTRARCP